MMKFDETCRGIVRKALTPQRSEMRTKGGLFNNTSKFYVQDRQIMLLLGTQYNCVIIKMGF